MKGLILINAYYNSEEYLYQAVRLQREFANKGIGVDIKKNISYPIKIADNNIQSTFGDYNFCIFWDKDKYILNAISKIGIPVFNNYDALTKCDDKMLTYLELAGNNIPMPKTLSGESCYNPNQEISKESLYTIQKELGFPLIIKESVGSLGKGVYLVNNMQELADVLDKVKLKPHLLQEFVADSYGRDIRAIVIGGKVIGGMLRHTAGGFRSNIADGGTGKACTISRDLADIAVRVAHILQLDYCSVDFLLDKNDKYKVCEVNSNAFFYMFERVTNINVGQLYAQHIIDKLSQQ